VPGGCPLLNTAVDADDGNPVLRERVRKALMALQDRITAITKEGVKAGHIRKGTDPQKLSTLIISTLEGALMMSRLNRDREPLRTVRAYLQNHLESLRA
jgi:TetR/AcrR family transcriptional repressor of nem operon